MKMRKYLQIVLILTTVTLITGACNEPVFYTVSLEVEPKDPVIRGGPTNIIAFNNRLYVASGIYIYTYTSASGWKKMDSQPGGMITHIAAANGSNPGLYTLGESKIKRLANGVWELLGKEGGTDNYEFQSMYGADGVIFIGAENKNNFRIYYIDENETSNKAIKPLLDRSGELCGAAKGGSLYYLITKEAGAYRTANPAQGAEKITGSDGKSFSGIINLKEDNSGTVISITREGSLYIIGDSVTGTGISFNSDCPPTGALAIWHNPDSDNPDPVLLLAGRQNPLYSTSATSFNYGYLELELNSLGTGASFREPGTAYPSSIDNNDRFKSTIGKQPVNHMFQTPKIIDPKMIIFASTQKNGLWSYRVIGGTPQWNAEEEL
jgi:hypothetical protein